MNDSPLPSPGSHYALLDSGEGEKLERFGEMTLARPSSVCLWRKRHPKQWATASAVFVPGKDQEDGGWRFKGKSFETWNMHYEGCTLVLRLQRNGQIGLFPEHGTYLEEVAPFLQGRWASRPRLLNLFAYTGLASVFFARRGYSVTHVDLSKKALSWARENFLLNQIPEDSIRFICDDAIKFLERETKRGSKYDAVIVDPPSFSRTSKENYWKLEEIISRIVEQCAALLSEKSSPLVVTCHHPGIGAEMLANLLKDCVSTKEQQVIAKELALPEHESSRVLPAGSFAALIGAKAV